MNPPISKKFSSEEIDTGAHINISINLIDEQLSNESRVEPNKPYSYEPVESREQAIKAFKEVFTQNVKAQSIPHYSTYKPDVSKFSLENHDSAETYRCLRPYQGGTRLTYPIHHVFPEPPKTYSPGYESLAKLDEHIKKIMANPKASVDYPAQLRLLEAESKRRGLARLQAMKEGQSIGGWTCGTTMPLGGVRTTESGKQHQPHVEEHAE